MNRAVLATCVVAALAAPALADATFEQQAAAARTVANLDEVAWALFAPCTQGDEVQQRQCRLVRDDRAKLEIGSTMLVEADPDSFALGTFNAAKKSVTLQLTSCIRCTDLQIEGKPFHITGAAARVEGGKVRTPLLYDNARQFPDEAAARTYAASVQGARVQMIIKLADRKRWQVSGKDGLLVEVLAWRVFVPCTGAVLIASPASSAVAPDRKTCPAPPA